MKTPPLKILLLGDASNYHATLAGGLRELGHQVTVMSNGSRWQKTQRDIDITRPFGGKIGGAIHYLDLTWRHRADMCGYDVVSLAGPYFTELRPSRLVKIFDRLKRDNRSVFLSALGTDPFYVQECLDPASPVAYSEWRLFDRPGALAVDRPDKMKQWLDPAMLDYNRYIYDNVDGVTTALWEYHVSVGHRLPASRVGYVGLPIDVASIQFKPLDLNPGEPVNLFLGRHSYRQSEKGTDLLEQAARRVAGRHPLKARFTLVEDKPYAEYCRLLDSAHLVLDQAYSYTPAMNALLAMAMGKVAVTGAEPVFYDFIKERQLRPMVNARPDVEALTDSLERVVLGDREMLSQLSRDSRRFVERHNDFRVVARRALDFWTNHIER